MLKLPFLAQARKKFNPAMNAFNRVLDLISVQGGGADEAEKMNCNEVSKLLLLVYFQMSQKMCEIQTKWRLNCILSRKITKIPQL